MIRLVLFDNSSIAIFPNPVSLNFLKEERENVKLSTREFWFYREDGEPFPLDGMETTLASFSCYGGQGREETCLINTTFSKSNILWQV